MELALSPRGRQQVEIWRGKQIDEMTREEAIKALKDCATAYRDHLNDDKEVWERWQRWRFPSQRTFRPTQLQSDGATALTHDQTNQNQATYTKVKK